MRTLRIIEDLESAIVRMLATGQNERQARWLLDRLNDIVSRHNRCAGEGPPMPPRSLEELRRRAAT